MRGCAVGADEAITKLMVKKILFISLSNIGDAILTLPALTILKDNFPQAKITVIASIRSQEVFKLFRGIDRVIIFDKKSSLKDKFNLITDLRQEKFDALLDLRRSFFGLLIPAKYKISFFKKIPREITHMQQRHLFSLVFNSSLLLNYPDLNTEIGRAHV